MKKIIIIVIGAIIIIAGLAVYFFGQGKNVEKPLVEKKTDQASQTNNSPASSAPVKSDHPYVGDDFTIIPPAGWIQINMPSTLVSYQNSKETHPKGSAAEKINFKSYIAVSFDNAGGQTLDGVTELIKRQTKAVAPTISFASVTNGAIDGQPAKFMEADVSMQNVDFKVMIAVALKGNKYFTISSNTTAEKWPGYRGLFYEISDSFKFKN